VIQINSSLLITTFHSSVIRALVYNDTPVFTLITTLHSSVIKYSFITTHPSSLLPLWQPTVHNMELEPVILRSVRLSYDSNCTLINSDNDHRPMLRRAMSQSLLHRPFFLNQRLSGAGSNNQQHTAWLCRHYITPSISSTAPLSQSWNKKSGIRNESHRVNA
jgi:hypothetical protein